MFNEISMFRYELESLVNCLERETVPDSKAFKLFRDAKRDLDSGEFMGVPSVGRNTLWANYKPLVQENIFKRFKLFCLCHIDGFLQASRVYDKRRPFEVLCWVFKPTQVTPHIHSCTYNPEHLGAIFVCSIKSVVYTVEKFCEVINKIVRDIKSSNFQYILRVLLIKHYNDFPQNTLHGFFKILTIATSEAIAEQGQKFVAVSAGSR
jgi:hypothetical protein